MAYDPARRRVLLFGGVHVATGDPSAPLGGGGSDVDTVLTDTWSWDGGDWHRLEAADADVVAAPDPRMAYDAADAEMLVDTVCTDACYHAHARLFAWSDTDGHWVRRTAPGPMPWNWCCPRSPPDSTGDRAGSTATTSVSGRRSFKKRPTPLIVPPVPEPYTNASILPCICVHSSGPVVSKCTRGLAGLAN